jgi:hypothetical protein
MLDGVTDGDMDGTLTWEDVLTFLAVEGTLYIDLIDAKKKELIVGRGRYWLLTKDREKKLKSMSL